ncbi:hypothetical protein Tco_0770383 [Tanacetum coccineum]|uniref:Reverse transcriptase domain-containing protein n=1 Tax=Tanacetum coccineum TaxID=301880 RepID=A0ABQ4ZFM1_9ASTR
MINYGVVNVSNYAVVTNRETLRECRKIEEAHGPTPKGRVTHTRIRASKPEDVPEKEGTQVQEKHLPNKKRLRKAEPYLPSKRDVYPKDGSEGKYEPTKASEKNKPPEKVIVNDDYLDQPITIGGNLSMVCRTKLIKVLCKNANAFAWVPMDMTGIPCFLAEHQLKTYPHIDPRVQKKRSIARDRRKVVKEEVVEWLKYGIVKRVQYPTWVDNPVLVKKSDGSWTMYIDFKDLNKACPKDLYPLSEIDWKIESLMGFKYKCFFGHLSKAGGYHIQGIDSKDSGSICGQHGYHEHDRARLDTGYGRDIVDS